MDKLEPVKIYPQKCFDCQLPLNPGDEAYAHVSAPVAICVKCREKKPPQVRAVLAVAVVEK